MKTKELKQKSPKELAYFLRESREKLRQMQFDLAARKLKDVNQIRKTRRDIARILTFEKSVLGIKNQVLSSDGKE